VLDWELGFVEADLLHFEYLVPQQSRAAHVGDRSVSDVSEVSPLLLKHRMRSTAFPDPERLTPRLSRASMSSRTPVGYSFVSPSFRPSSCSRRSSISKSWSRVRMGRSRRRSSLLSSDDRDV
jgi:hypothetical protein